MKLAPPPGHVIVRLPKAVLVLTEVESLRGLRRGKFSRRRAALARRLAPKATEAIAEHAPEGEPGT